jgi:hypothetical protein
MVVSVVVTTEILAQYAGKFDPAQNALDMPIVTVVRERIATAQEWQFVQGCRSLHFRNQSARIRGR